METYENMLAKKLRYEQFSRDMIQSQFFADLVQRNKPWRHVARFLLNLSLFAAFFFFIAKSFQICLYFGLTLYPLYLYFQGLLIAGFLVHSHEFTHRQIKNKYINDFMGIVCGLIGWINFYSFQFAHNLHHRNIGNIDAPEAGAPVSAKGLKMVRHDDASHIIGNKIFEFSKIGWFLISWPFYIFFGDYCSWLLPFYRKEKLVWKSVYIFSVFLLLNISFFIWNPIYFTFFYLIPVLIGGNRILLITAMHHAHADSVFMSAKHHNLHNVIMANTDRDYGWVTNFFMLNNGYHIAHHMNPKIAYYDFKKATAYLLANKPVDLEYNYYPRSHFYRDFVNGIYEKRLDYNPEFYQLQYIDVNGAVRQPLQKCRENEFGLP